jgi:hypothetical protein
VLGLLAVQELLSLPLKPALSKIKNLQNENVKVLPSDFGRGHCYKWKADERSVVRKSPSLFKITLKAVSWQTCVLTLIFFCYFHGHIGFYIFWWSSMDTLLRRQNSWLVIYWWNLSSNQKTAENNDKKDVDEVSSVKEHLNVNYFP